MDIRALSRRLRGRRVRLVALLGVAALLAAALLGLGADDPKGASGTRSVASSGDAADEPRLDDVRGIAPRTTRAQRPGGRRAKVVEVRRPGGEPGDAASTSASGGGEGPPERILDENKKLRRELEDLKALERERRRVSRALVRAGAMFDGPVRLGPEGLAWPVGGSVVSPFGQRWGRLHAGVDIAARAGTVIHAAADGPVVLAGPTGGYGNYVCVQHTKRLTTCYAHLSRFFTRRGEMLHQGDPLGLVGCTGHCFGDHLHFETWVDGRPVDPMRYF